MGEDAAAETDVYIVDGYTPTDESAEELKERQRQHSAAVVLRPRPEQWHLSGQRRQREVSVRGMAAAARAAWAAGGVLAAAAAAGRPSSPHPPLAARLNSGGKGGPLCPKQPSQFWCWSTMFGQPPAVPGDGGKSSTSGASGSAVDSREPSIDREQKELFEMIAKLSLQLKGERCAMEMDDNYVFEISNFSALAKSIAWAEEASRTVGDKMRKELGDDDKGHPQGEKPDALPASSIVRLVEVIKEAGGGSIERYVRSKLACLGQQGQEDVLKVLYVLDGRAQQPMEIRSTRCFKNETEEGGGETMELTAEATKDRGLGTASGTTRKLGLLGGAGVTVAEDLQRGAKSRRMAPSAPVTGLAENEDPGTTEEDSPSEGRPSDPVRRAISTLDPGCSSDGS